MKWCSRRRGLAAVLAAALALAFGAALLAGIIVLRRFGL